MKTLLLVGLLTSALVVAGCSGSVSSPSVEQNAASTTDPNIAENNNTVSPGTGAALEAVATEPAEPVETETPVTTAAEGVETPTEAEASVTATPELSTIPKISFKGTSVGNAYDVGDIIVLDASTSSVELGEIISFQWEQLDNGKTAVDLINADTGTASFAATEEINRERLHFRVTVVTSESVSESSELLFAWNVISAITEDPNPIPVIAPIEDGYMVLGQTGGFYAFSAESVYVANQETSSVDHINPATDETISTDPVSDVPDLVTYVADTNSMYVSLISASLPTGGSPVGGTIKRYQLTTGDSQLIPAGGVVKSMAALDERLYFTVESGTYEWNVRSIGNDNVIVDHGTINGDLIELNPVSKELIAVWQDTSPASVYRFSFDVNDQLVEQQMSRELGGNARDLAISSDGNRLAVLAGGGNGAGYTVHDIEASDLTVSSGAWDTGPYPSTGDFSDSGEFFVASNNDDIMVFDAVNHTLTETHVVLDGHCGLGYNSVPEVLFSEDDQHIMAKLVCGFDNEKSVLFFYQKP